MLSSCPPDTENQQSLTDGNSRIEPMVTHFPAITIKQMCRAAPHAFRTGTSQSKPSQTLEDWAATQPFAKFAQSGARLYAERPLTAVQAKRLAFYAQLQAAA